MTRLYIDPADFTPIIEATVAEAIRRLQVDRPRDRLGKVIVGKAEAAQVLGGVSLSTLDRWRKNGLPSVKIDGKVFFRLETLGRWTAEREGGAQ